MNGRSVHVSSPGYVASGPAGLPSASASPNGRHPNATARRTRRVRPRRRGERVARFRMPKVQRAVDVGNHDAHGNRVRLRHLGGNVAVVVVPRRGDVRSGVEQRPFDAQLARFAHTPGLHALAPDAVLVLHAGLEHHDLEAVAAPDALASAEPPMPPPTITTSQLLMPLIRLVGRVDQHRARAPTISVCAETSLSSVASNRPRHGRRSRRPPASTSARCRASPARARCSPERSTTPRPRWRRSPSACCAALPARRQPPKTVPPLRRPEVRARLGLVRVDRLSSVVSAPAGACDTFL